MPKTSTLKNLPQILEGENSDWRYWRFVRVGHSLTFSISRPAKDAEGKWKGGELEFHPPLTNVSGSIPYSQWDISARLEPKKGYVLVVTVKRPQDKRPQSIDFAFDSHHESFGFRPRITKIKNELKKKLAPPAPK